jgi:acetoin utilization protein AcuC
MFLVHDERSLRYSFKNHPFSSEKARRAGEILIREGIVERLDVFEYPEDILYLFHEYKYVSFVKNKSIDGRGYIDYGDTPAYPGIHQDALWVVRATLTAIDTALERNEVAINLNGGLHHASRDHGSGFCVYNDVAIGISYLLNKGIKNILYVDIDAHHGDGVFYGFIDNPDVYIIDYHEDPRSLFPGTGYEYETGEGEAKGTKRNVIREPFSTEIDMGELDDFVKGRSFNFIIMQIGADGLEGDPLTHLKYRIESYVKIVNKVFELSKKMCNKRLVLLGGGGYSIENSVKAYVKAIGSLVSHA